VFHTDFFLTSVWSAQDWLGPVKNVFIKKVSPFVSNWPNDLLGRFNIIQIAVIKVRKKCAIRSSSAGFFYFCLKIGTILLIFASAKSA